MNKSNLTRLTKRARHAALYGIFLLSGSATAQSLDLLESLRLALLNDAIYQAALATNQADQEVLPQARAQLRPNLSLNATRSNNWTDSETPGLQGPVENSYEYVGGNTALSVKQPLYRKFNFELYKQAKSQVNNANAVLDHERHNLVMRISHDFFSALLAQEQLQLVLSQNEVYAAQLKSAKRGFETGAGTRIDIDDAQARYDLSLAQELEARQNVDFTRRQLQVIINQPVDSLMILDAQRMELTRPVPDNVDEWIARGESNNAELRALLANVEAARFEIEKAKSGHYPTLDLYAQRSKSESDTNTTINNKHLTTSVGLQFSMPLWSGGSVNSQTRQAAANLEKVKYQYEARRREIGQQVRKEFQNVSEGVLKVKALELAERSAGQAVYSNQRGFQAGTRNRVDILNAQQQLMNARRDLTEARYVFMLARIRLHGLMGNSSDDELKLVNSWLNVPERTRAYFLPILEKKEIPVLASKESNIQLFIKMENEFKTDFR
jgi:outer membrane protein, protease secretion system